MQKKAHSIEIWRDSDMKCMKAIFHNFSESILDKTSEAVGKTDAIWGSNTCSFISPQYDSQIIDMTITMAMAIVLEEFRIAEDIVSISNASLEYPDYEDVAEDFNDYIFDVVGNVCYEIQNQLRDYLETLSFLNDVPFSLDASRWLDPESDNVQSCVNLLTDAISDYESQLEACSVLTVEDQGDHFELLDGNHDEVNFETPEDKSIWLLSKKENSLLKQFRGVAEKTDIRSVMLGKITGYSETFRRLLREILGSNTSIFYETGKGMIKEEPEIVMISEMS